MPNCAAKGRFLLDGQPMNEYSCSLEEGHDGWHQLEEDGKILFVWQWTGSEIATKEQQKLIDEVSPFRRFNV